MSRESIRTDIVKAVEAVKVAYASPIIIEYDNVVVVDTAKATEPFICLEIKIRDAYQADISNTPTKRWIGSIEISVAVKKGTGSSKALKILDFFTERLERKQFGSVRTHVAGVAHTTEQLGWCYFTSDIYFWSDQVL